jgi:hypothetical protein
MIATRKNVSTTDLIDYIHMVIICTSSYSCNKILCVCVRRACVKTTSDGPRYFGYMILSFSADY